MIFLMNKSRVVAEMVTLAKLKLSESLSVDLDAVDCTLELDGDVIVPNFSVQVSDDVTELEKQRVADAVRDVWVDVKPEFEFRLKQLDQHRMING